MEEEAGDESNVRHSGEVVGKEVRPTACEGSQLGRASAICIAVAIQDCGRAWPTHCLRLLEICLGGAYLIFVLLHLVASSLDSIFYCMVDFALPSSGWGMLAWLLQFRVPGV